MDDSKGKRISLALKLKLPKHDVSPCSGSSKFLTTTNVPFASDPRQYYLDHSATVDPPFISSSAFVPRALTEHLMRFKKDSAIGVKFQSHNTPPDAITNMEGAMHTFMTPIMLVAMHGDYIYRGGHGIVPFEKKGEMQQARMVILSAAIQPDFETRCVMLIACTLQDDEVLGQDLPEDFTVLDTASKQNQFLRAKYDGKLKRQMVAHLTKDGRLPDLHEVTSQNRIMSLQQTIKFLEDHIKSPVSSFEDIYGRYTLLENGAVISLELLFNSALHQLRNEISALEILAPQGYVYTSDPAVIFAQEISATLLNRISFAALKSLSSNNEFQNMKVFGFNDYADPVAIPLLKHALMAQPHIHIVSKESLFKGHDNTYKALPGSGADNSLLVIHNNSDAFGQNVESEWATGSLDGAVGANSSAAASLRRDRVDLVNFESRYL